MKYEILTKLKVHDELRDWDDESYSDKLWKEQNEKLSSLGYEQYNNLYLILNGNGIYKIDCIYDSIEALAIKDGIDLVKFDNGNIGFIAYYNGFSLKENNFQIVCNWDEIIDKFGHVSDIDDDIDIWIENIVNHLNDR